MYLYFIATCSIEIDGGDVFDRGDLLELNLETQIMNRIAHFEGSSSVYMTANMETAVSYDCLLDLLKQEKFYFFRSTKNQNPLWVDFKPIY